MKGCGKTGEPLTAQNAEFHVQRFSEILVFSLEYLLHTTSPVSAPNASRVKGVHLGGLRNLLAADLLVEPRKGIRMEWERRRAAVLWICLGNESWGHILDD